MTWKALQPAVERGCCKLRQSSENARRSRILPETRCKTLRPDFAPGNNDDYLSWEGWASLIITEEFVSNGAETDEEV